jgi:hypothetical protein
MRPGTAYCFDENAQTMREGLVQLRSDCVCRRKKRPSTSGERRFVEGLDLRFSTVINHDTYTKMIDVKYPHLRADWSTGPGLQLHVVYRTNSIRVAYSTSQKASDIPTDIVGFTNKDNCRSTNLEWVLTNRCGARQCGLSLHDISCTTPPVILGPAASVLRLEDIQTWVFSSSSASYSGVETSQWSLKRLTN